MNSDLTSMIYPRHVAVIGATPRETAASFRVIRNLLKSSFSGAIYPINAKYDEVQGIKCFDSLESLPHRPDMAFIALGAESVPGILEDIGRAGVPAAISNAGGITPVIEAAIQAAAAKNSVALCGPNNMGLINVNDRIALWTGSVLPPMRPGAVAVISQSGSVALSLAQDDRRLGLSHIITTGSEAVCTLADYISEVVNDSRVRVILLFVEAIRDPRGFRLAAEKAAGSGKQLVAVKVGRSEGAMQAVQSHSGALSGEDSVYDAFFKSCGVLRVNDLDELIEAGLLFSSSRPRAPRTGTVLITLSGGQAALLEDTAETVDLTLSRFDAEGASALAAVASPAIPPRNPLDTWGLGWDKDQFRRIFQFVVDRDEVGTIICAIDAPASGSPDVPPALDIADCFVEQWANTDKRLLFLNNSTAGDVNAEIRSRLEVAGIPYMLGMRPSLHVLGASDRLSAQDWVRQPSSTESPVRKLDRDSSGRALHEALRQSGVPMVKTLQVDSVEGALQQAERIGFPLVMKGNLPNVSHKSDLGLVHLGLQDAEAVRDAFADLQGELVKYDPSGGQIILQPMLQRGVELYIGARNDPDFGTVVIAGVGGVLVELMDDVSIRLGPISEAQALRMFAETKVAKLLSGVRGKGPFDERAAAAALAQLSKVVSATEGVASIEINPLIVQEDGAVGVDLVVEWSSEVAEEREYDNAV